MDSLINAMRGGSKRRRSSMCRSRKPTCKKQFDLGFGRRVSYQLSKRPGCISVDLDEEQKKSIISELSLLKSVDQVVYAMTGLSPAAMSAQSVITQLKTNLMNVLFKGGRLHKTDVEKMEQMISDADNENGGMYKKAMQGLFTASSTMSKDLEKSNRMFAQMASGKFDAVLKNECALHILAVVNVLIQYVKKYVDVGEQAALKAMFDRLEFEYEGNCRSLRKLMLHVYFKGDMSKPKLSIDVLHDCHMMSNKNMLCAMKEYFSKVREL
jgi:hypothetical protein